MHGNVIGIVDIFEYSRKLSTTGKKKKDGENTNIQILHVFVVDTIHYKLSFCILLGSK